MVLQDAVFGFLREPARKDVGQNHHVAAVCLKIACWVTFVTGLAVALLGVLASLFVLVGSEVLIRWFEVAGAPQGFIDVFSASTPFVFLLGLLATAFIVTLVALFLWWQNHTFGLWNAVADNALVWANVLAVVMLIFSVGDARFFIWDWGDGSMELAGGSNLVNLVLAILILVFANVASSKGELESADGAADGAADEGETPPGP